MNPMPTFAFPTYLLLNGLCPLPPKFQCFNTLTLLEHMVPKTRYLIPMPIAYYHFPILFFEIKIHSLRCITCAIFGSSTYDTRIIRKSHNLEDRYYKRKKGDENTRSNRSSFCIRLINKKVEFRKIWPK